MTVRDDDPPAPADAAEPRRLLEDPGLYGSDRSTSWALGLLRGAQPYRTPAGRKQRVQLRLGHTPRRRAPLLLRLAVAACVLLGGAAIVSAAIGRWPAWVTSAVQRVVGPRAEAPARARTRAHVARHVEAIVPPAPAPAVEPAAEPATPNVPWPELPIEPEAQPEIPRRVSRPAAPPRAPRVVAAAPAGQHASEDASGVSAAMRALRVERDPVRARGLLARYLAEHPNGTLAEEALALSIEAALAHHDADVVVLANRYLRLYPRGSFQTLALQARDGNTVVAQPPASPVTRDQ
jgi:hypothetical protein